MDRPWLLKLVIAASLTARWPAGPAAAAPADCAPDQLRPDGRCATADPGEAGATGAEVAPIAPEPTPGRTHPPVEPASQEQDDSASYLHSVAWWSFGVAAVGLSTWAITGSVALAEAKSLKDDCPDDTCSADREEDLDTARTLAHVATSGLAIGVIGAVTGGIALLAASRTGRSSPEPGDATSAAIRPLVGAGYLGVSGWF